MKNRWWIAALLTVAALGWTLPSWGGVLDRLHKKKHEDQDLALSCIQQKAWLAYFKDDKDNVSPIRDTMNTADDADWLGLHFTDYEGPRIRLGVLRVINKSAESEENNENGRIAVNVSGIQELLNAALYNTKRFDVVEEKRTSEVEKEQTRKDVMEPSPSSLISTGKVLGAQYLVYGTVNEWSPQRSQKGLGTYALDRLLPGPLGAIGSHLGIGGIGGSKQEAEVAITFVLTDAANGQNLFTTTERGRAGEWAIGVGGAQSGGMEQKTPVSYAVRACANKAAFKIAGYLRDRKWLGSVVDVKGPDIYVNAGSQQGMARENLLSVFMVKGIVKDTEGRMILGEDLKGIGTLRVDSVQTAFSIAHVENGCKGIKQGDRVEMATQPVLPPPPQGCKAVDRTLAP